MIPNGWSLEKLSDISQYRRGSFPQPYGLEKWFDDDGHPFVQVYDVDRNLQLKPQTKARISDLAADKSVLAPAGTVLVTLQGSIGRVAITQYSAYVDRTLLIIQGLKKPGCTLYFATCLQKLFAEERKRAPGGTIKTITKAALNNFEILWPPEGEQKKIAQILSTWDKAITTTEQLLTNSQQQKKALMQQLLTGKNRLLDKNGVRFNGEWQFQRISSVSTRVQRKTDGDDHPILTISSLSGFVRQDVRYSRYMAGESVKNYILLKKREFAYNKGNSKSYQFGCIFDLEDHESGLVPHVYVCFKLNEGLSHRYFKYLFAADYLKPQLGALVNTGVRNNGLLNIKPSEFLATKVPVPNIEEQERIADTLHASSETIKNLELQIKALENEKKALMQQLLTGKRRVSVSKETAR